MTSGGSSRVMNPVKIVIINTQYVETDATSFKSVVQKLTGKDSNAEAAKVENSQKKKKKHNQSGDGSFFMSDVSFKEFDRLLNDMPLINEILSDNLIN
ncbi:hypothetical protein TSUD_54620 [Trifolium subterraneum]|uniref:VQ domain-containing protein n=1 Tax=Trifolium subterraneum TaxID=3900 RepID=A0A2Z6NNV8_TRISU|nr:hypothetical protein TSUD_54620 [Trifolium subterraneum]